MSVQDFVRLAILSTRRENLQPVLVQLDSDGARSLICEQRHAANGRGDNLLVQFNNPTVLLRQHSLIIRELAGQHPRDKQALAQGKKEVAFILGELHLASLATPHQQCLQLPHRLLRNQYPQLVTDTLDSNLALDQSK